MGKILREIPVDGGDEPDAVADFSFILGDLNYRLESTYTEHIKRVKESRNLV